MEIFRTNRRRATKRENAYYHECARRKEPAIMLRTFRGQVSLVIDADTAYGAKGHFTLDDVNALLESAREFWKEKRKKVRSGTTMFCGGTSVMCFYRLDEQRALELAQMAEDAWEASQVPCSTETVN